MCLNILGLNLVIIFILAVSPYFSLKKLIILLKTSSKTKSIRLSLIEPSPAPEPNLAKPLMILLNRKGRMALTKAAIADRIKTII